MNNFNTKRFRRLFIKQLAEHYKTYLMGLAVLTGVMLVGGGFFVYLIPSPLDLGTQVALFTGVFFLSGTIFTSTIFADLNDKKKAIGYLTLPASHLEKFFVAWLFSYAIFSVVYTGTFYMILALLLNLRHWPNMRIEVLNVFTQPFSTLFVIFSMLHAIALWGAVFFEKLHFIKTAFCFFIAVIVFSLLNTSVLQGLVGQQVRPATPFSSLVFIENGRTMVVSAPLKVEPVAICVAVAAAVIFWLAAYYRLKEKQI